MIKNGNDYIGLERAKFGGGLMNTQRRTVRRVTKTELFLPS